MAKPLHLTAVIWPEGKPYVSRCPEIGVASYGKTPAAAREALQEAVELWVSNARKLGVLALLPVFVLALALAGCHSQTTVKKPSTESSPVIKPNIVAYHFRTKNGETKGSSADLSFAGDTAYVKAIVPGGIGEVRLELISGAWPRKVVVSLWYAPDRPLRQLEAADVHTEVSRSDYDQWGSVHYRRHATDGNMAIEVGPFEPTGHRVLYVGWIDQLRH